MGILTLLKRTAASVTTPAANKVRIFFDSADGVPKFKDDAGATTSFLTTGTAGIGDVAGPAGAVDDRIATFNGLTGKVIQDGGVLVADLATAAALTSGLAGKQGLDATLTALSTAGDIEAARNALKVGPRYCFEVCTDFAAANLAATGPDLSRTVSGTGAAVTADIGTATQPGFAECFLGTTTTGRVGYGTYSRTLKLGGGALRFVVKAALSNLSDGTNTFTQWIGLTNNYGAEGAELACFRYTHSVNGGKWQSVTSLAGVQTAADTGVTVVAGAEKLFDIRVNSAGTEVTFYINGVLVATHSTNIPTGELGAMVNTIRSAGTADIVSLNIDLLYCRIDFTTPRW